MSHSEPDQKNYVERAAEIYRKHGPFIRSVIGYKVRNQELADDLYQDFFVTLSTKPIPENIKDLKGFLFLCITRDIKDSIRRVIRYQDNLQKYAIHYQHLESGGDLLDGEVDPEELDAVFRAIENHLSQREAEAIVLRYKYGHDTKKMSETMGIKPRSIHRYVSSGLNKMRQVFTAKEKVSS